MTSKPDLPRGDERSKDETTIPSHILSQESQPQDIEKQPARITNRNGPRKVSAYKSLGLLDRFLFVWIILAMVVGVLLGNFVENTGPALQKGKFVGVSIPIAIGLLVMMYPILCKVRYESLHELFSHRDIWKQIAFSVVVNWVVAPFVMVSYPISLS
jgi:ACR3 family arsenite transporter